MYMKKKSLENGRDFGKKKRLKNYQSCVRILEECLNSRK